MKTALVTGATRGIGRAAALRLGDAGWWVLGTGRHEEDGWELQRELRQRAGGRFVAADLSRDGVPDTLVDHARQETGRLDLLVNNAGVHGQGVIPDIPLADYDAMMSLNVRAPFLLCQSAIPFMRAQGGGVVINVSSEAGISAVGNQAPYNMSKASLIMLTKSIAVDHAADGIRAVSVCPGTTHTPLVEQALAAAPDPVAQHNALADARPARRLGRPEEIAAVIAFAAGDEAAYMTGCEITVDGGRTAQ